MFMLQIQIFYNLISTISTQYFKLHQPPLQAVPYYQPNYLPNNYFHQETDSSEDSDGRRCKCSCFDCSRPKRCCRKVCRNCKTKEIQGLVVIPYPVPLLMYSTEKTVENSTKAKENKTKLLSLESENISTFSTAPVYVEDGDDIKNVNTNKVHLGASNHKYSNLKNINKNKYMVARINEDYRPNKNTVIRYKKLDDRKKYEVIPLPNKLAIEVLKGLQKYDDLKLK
ncbi:uncharacterized protein LOC115439826 [Manduca sexta]|uniref:Uncharacterized protein n=1 Tax=Manduca sexta TaxID=7130 RepID=A0A921YTU5_MANSE|nr:uncharacterized protein LOC115439826 [Manduca sexta]KAG6444542.1 hypothetical protein O3G_MSEX003435 [Manduca sexta]